MHTCAFDLIKVLFIKYHIHQFQKNAKILFKSYLPKNVTFAFFNRLL